MLAPQPIQGRDGLRVLLVDDDSLVRWALGSMLIQHGCAVVEGQDAESATRVVADPSNVFDVILLDYRLPDVQGFELLTTLKQLAPQSRVVMMSSDISADDLAEAFRRGACAFVPKPFDLDHVWTLVGASSRPPDRPSDTLDNDKLPDQ
jgi:DNA-binding NtrC family response regulator